MKSLSKIFNAIYLCIRFPFLYPRNRFSDKHTVYIRWMSNLVYKYYSKSYYDISLAYKFYKDPQECTTITKQVIFKDKYNFKARLIRNNTILRFYSDILKEPYDFNIQKYVGDNFKISGITVSKSTFNHVEIQWYPHGWMFVIYKIDSQEDEPYDTFSEVYTSYLNCLEAGIIRALNII